MVSLEHVAALTEARRRMPRHTWQQLAARLADAPSSIDPASIRQATADLLNRDAAWILAESFEKHAQATGNEIAAAMVAYGTTDSERKDPSACAMKAFSTVAAIAWRACASLAAARPR